MALKAAGANKLGENNEGNEEPMPKMPCKYPFQPCTDDAKADPKDTFKEGSTLTPALQAHLESERLMRKKAKGTVDPINDFETPEAKAAKAEQIAKRIFEEANKEVAGANEKTANEKAIHEIQKKFALSIQEVKAVIAHAKHSNSKMFNTEEPSDEEGEDKQKAGALEAMEGPLKEEDAKLLSNLPKTPTKAAIKSIEEETKRFKKPVKNE